MTKECYMCRRPVDLIAKLNMGNLPKSTQSMGPLAKPRPWQTSIELHKRATIGNLTIEDSKTASVTGALKTPDALESGTSSHPAVLGHSLSMTDDPPRALTSTFVISPPIAERLSHRDKVAIAENAICGAILVAPDSLHHARSREFLDSEVRNDSPVSMFM